MMRHLLLATALQRSQVSRLCIVDDPYGCLLYVSTLEVDNEMIHGSVGASAASCHECGTAGWLLTVVQANCWQRI